MTAVYKTALERVFAMPYQDGEGETVVPSSASFTVLDENGDDIAVSTPIDVSGSPASVVITVTGAQNTITVGSIRGFRTVIVSFTDAIGNQCEQRVTYILEEASLMEPGTNSFARFEHFVMLLQELPLLKAASGAADRDLKMALINAYYNIGNLNVSFADELVGVHSTIDIGAGDLVTLTDATLLKLKKASLIEADSILGGNPVEDRRRMGLMSHSAGESAHFFRPSKPIDLPVAKDTARALAPLVRYTMRVGR